MLRCLSVVEKHIRNRLLRDASDHGAFHRASAAALFLPFPPFPSPARSSSSSRLICSLPVILPPSASPPARRPPHRWLYHGGGLTLSRAHGGRCRAQPSLNYPRNLVRQTAILPKVADKNGSLPLTDIGSEAGPPFLPPGCTLIVALCFKKGLIRLRHGSHYPAPLSICRPDATVVHGESK